MDKKERNKQKHKRRGLANIVLVVMGLLFLFAYPFRANLWGALLMHISGAALIGGLADWYAVTALFSKPLGIPYKTAILPRSKDRLIEAARTMMVDELLRRSSVYKIIKQEEVPRRILAFLVSPKGQADCQPIFVEMERIGQLLLKHPSIREEISQLASTSAKDWQVSPLLIRLGQVVMKTEMMDRLWRAGNQIVRHLLLATSIRPYLAAMIGLVMERYAENSFWRELLLAMGSQSLSPEALADKICQKGAAYLEKQEDLSSPLGQFVYKKLENALLTFSQRSDWQAQVEAQKGPWVVKWLSRLSQLTEDLDWTLYMEKGRRLLLYMGKKALLDPKQMERLEDFMLWQIVPLLRYIRPFVDKAVTSELGSYSPDKISRTIQDKLYNDLQMVRINGSMVGAVLGGGFYLVTLLVKGGLW